MNHNILLLVLSFPLLSESLNCDKVFNYYENYGQNGFDVTCHGLVKGYENILENIAIYSEITLTIIDSLLYNVTSKIFHNIRNIRQLYLTNSTFVFDKKLAVFRELNQLEKLHIENTNLNITSSTFQGLKGLKELVLQNNSIDSVNSESFINLPSLEILEISRNKIKQLNNVPICQLKNLKEINFESNYIAYLDKSYFDCDKPPTSVEIRSNNLQLNVNDAPMFKRDISGPLELIVINLSNNFITDLGNSLQDLKSVKSLNLDGNKLTAIDDVTFSSFKYINRISIRNNSLSRIGENVFMNKMNLMHLDLSHNKLFNLKLNSMPSLGYVDLCDNNISLTNLRMYNVTSLKTLHLCNNNVTTIPGHYFQNVSSITELNLANNNLQLTTSSFYSLDRLEVFNLSSTNLSKLPLSVFTTLKSLRILDLSSNHFTSLDDNTFTGLVNLNTLDLSGNLLEIFHGFSIRPLKNLHVLDLANNKLEHVDYELIFSQLPTLSYFNIQANLLTCNFLLKIVSYFEKKNITYTTTDPVDFAKENVGGIYCSNKNATEQAMLKNRSASYGGSSIFFDFGMLVVTVLCAIIIAVAVFRIYVYLKRRQYRADEFELVEE